MAESPQTAAERAARDQRAAAIAEARAALRRAAGIRDSADVQVQQLSALIRRLEAAV